MFNKHLFFILFLLYDIDGRPKEIKCPDYCKCDVFQTLRRATCQNKKLYSIEIDIPPQAEMLDLSYNQISELGNNIFLEIGLSNLKLLNLSHNKVSQIHFNGFEGLSNLKTLDLSYNMLRYFTEQWFISLSSLQELYLRGNNLKSINDEPRLNLNYLRVLDISYCAIIGLNPGVFEKIPNLEILDVSGNFLVNFNIGVISSLPELTTLIVKDNNFDCKNMEMAKLKNYTQNKGIGYVDPCIRNRKNKNDKFQRMMMEQIPEKNVWIFDEEEEGLKNTKIIEVCNDPAVKNNTINKVDSMLMEVIELSPMLSFLIVLTIGILIGLLIGCSVEIRQKTHTGRNTEEMMNLPDGAETFILQPRNTDSSPRRPRQTSMNFRRQNSTGSNFRPRTRSCSSRKGVREDRSILLVNECGLSESTPVLSRKMYS